MNLPKVQNRPSYRKTLACIIVLFACIIFGGAAEIRS